MDVALLYFDDCPNWETTEAYLRQLVGETPQLALRCQRVDTPEAAERFGFRGSPTVLVDGEDPFASADAPFGLTCRVYQTPEGLAGSPTLAQLREVLTRG